MLGKSSILNRRNLVDLPPSNVCSLIRWVIDDMTLYLAADPTNGRPRDEKWTIKNGLCAKWARQLEKNFERYTTPEHVARVVNAEMRLAKERHLAELAEPGKKFPKLSKPSQFMYDLLWTNWELYQNFHGFEHMCPKETKKETKEEAKEEAKEETKEERKEEKKEERKGKRKEDSGSGNDEDEPSQSPPKKKKANPIPEKSNDDE